MWHHKAKIGPKWGQICTLYIPTVMKRSNSMIIIFSRLVIHFWDQFFKTVILWPIPNPSFWRHSKVGSKETEICISSTNGEEKSKPKSQNDTLRWGKYEANFKIFKTLFSSYDVINTKLGQEGPEFVHYVDRKIKINNHTIFEESNWFLSGQFLNITKYWCLPIAYFLFVTSLTPNLAKEGPDSYITFKWW